MSNWIDKAVQANDDPNLDGPERLSAMLEPLGEWLNSHKWNADTQQWEAK